MVRKGLKLMKVDISHYEDIDDLEFMQGVRIKQKSRNKVKQTNKDPVSYTHLEPTSRYAISYAVF